MTAEELLADYQRARKNIHRLAQVATIAARRWEAHEHVCELCQNIEDDTTDLCAEGLALFTRAEAFKHAVWTLKGVMTWK